MKTTLIISFIFASSTFLLGDVIHVPADTAMIQGGIYLAGDGDTVLVAEGTYYENINFRGKAITVASQFIMDGDTSHISKTIINGGYPINPDSGSVVYFISGEDTTSEIQGFTITGGTGTNFIWGETAKLNTGGGINVFGSGCKIVNNHITSNNINQPDREIFGGGVMCYSVKPLPILISHNIIGNNLVSGFDGGGGGVYIESNGFTLFKGNLITHNEFAGSDEGHAGGCCLRGSMDGLTGKINFINNIVTYNHVRGPSGESYGAGIYSEHPDLDLHNNIIAYNQNHNGSGGGFYFYNVADWPGRTKSFLSNNTIVGNKSNWAGGILIQRSDVLVINSIIWDNIATDELHTLSPTRFKVKYSNVKGGWTGEGNIDFDPMFSDSLFNLSDSSFCVGNGIDSTEFDGIWYKCTPYDINGGIRPHLTIDNRVDIGAVESPYNQVMIDNIQRSDIKLLHNFQLSQNYPNPFNASTIIEFTLPESEFVTLKIFNILGEEVATLVQNKLQAGNHTYQFDGRDFASGVYMYRIETGDFKEVRKMILLR